MICTCLCFPLNAQISIDPALWLDANKGIKVQGNRVIDWEDQSSHQRDLNLLPGHNRADWVDGVNGKKAVAFRKAHFAFDGNFLGQKEELICVEVDIFEM